ncbi:MAG TPA: glyoxalase superfamily protein [Anaerolineae bacterium]
MLEHLAYTVIYASDMEKSTVFYRDVLGIPVDFVVEGWTQFKSQGAALVLHPKLKHQSDQASGSAVHITFRLDDLQAEYERLTAQAVPFLAPPAKTAFGMHATLVDPDGNQIDLIEWATPAAKHSFSEKTVVNEILSRAPEAMQVLEDHGIRICGGCIVLLNASLRETAEYSGLSANETSQLVKELGQTVDRQAGTAVNK